MVPVLEHLEAVMVYWRRYNFVEFGVIVLVDVRFQNDTDPWNVVVGFCLDIEVCQTFSVFLILKDF